MQIKVNIFAMATWYEWWAFPVPLTLSCNPMSHYQFEWLFPVIMSQSNDPARLNQINCSIVILNFKLGDCSQDACAFKFLIIFRGSVLGHGRKTRIYFTVFVYLSLIVFCIISSYNSFDHPTYVQIHTNRKPNNHGCYNWRRFHDLLIKVLGMNNGGNLYITEPICLSTC